MRLILEYIVLWIITNNLRMNSPEYAGGEE